MTRPPKRPPKRLVDDRVRTWLTKLAREESERLVHFVLRCTPVHDSDVAAELVHDAMLMILAGEVEIPNDPEKARRTLRHTIRNLARNHWRSERRWCTVPLESVEVHHGQTWVRGERGWRLCARLESRRAVGLALEALTSAQREVVVFRYLEEWTIAEIAAKRGCTESTVKNLLGTARATLRRELEGRYGHK